jgi:hypothetical protein
MSDPVIPDPGTSLSVKGTASAKEISKWSMVIAALWIGILSAVKAAWPLFSGGKDFGLSMSEIIYSGLALAAVFTPVYFSIFLEKIRDIKTGGGA